MKRVIFGLVGFLILVAGTARRAQAQCSAATLSNNEYYAWVEQQLYPNPGYEVGYINFESGGNLTLYIEGGTNGGISTYSYTGNYSIVNANDCTVDVNLDLNGSWTYFQGTITDVGDQVFLNTLATGGETIVHLVYLPGVGVCGPDTLGSTSGVTYSYDSDEVYPATGGDVGYITFSVSGSSYTFNGEIYGGLSGSNSYHSFSGTYSVATNCTVTLTDTTDSITLWGVAGTFSADTYLIQASPTGVNDLVDLQ